MINKIKLDNILIILFFLNLFLFSLYNGGGWNINEHIDFSERLIKGFSYYSNGENDLFIPSSPYFPGIGFFSYFIHKIGFTDINVISTILTSLACLIGFVLFYLLRKLASLIYPNVPKEIISITSIILITTNFTAFMKYMGSFKPDAMLLVIGLIALIIFEKTKKLKIHQLILIGLLLILVVLVKQSFFLIYFLIYISIVFREDLKIKQKILILISYSLLGVITLFVMFYKVENLYYFTIEAISNHEFLELKEITRIFGGTILNNFIFISLLLYFFVSKIRARSFNKLEVVYLTFSCAWLLFAIISSVKSGGNRGNIEVGLVVFLPLVFFSINELSKISFFNNKINLLFKIIIAIIIIPYYSFSIVKNTKKLIHKHNNDIVSIDYLSKNFKGKKAFVDGNTYLISKRSGLNIITETETIGHFNFIKNYDFTILKNAIEEKKYDLIFLDKSLDFLKDKEIQIKIDNNYQVIKQNGVPDNIKHKILIPKKN